MARSALSESLMGRSAERRESRQQIEQEPNQILFGENVSDIMGGGLLSRSVPSPSPDQPFFGGGVGSGQQQQQYGSFHGHGFGHLMQRRRSGGHSMVGWY